MSKKRNEALDYDRIYVSDFETIARGDRMEVWLADNCKLSDFSHQHFLSIEDWIDWVLKNPAIYYFHNLKFDGTYILYYLLENGWEHTTEKGNSIPHTFSTLITEDGLWYSIRIWNEDGEIIEIRDSLKKMNTSVKNIAKAYKLDIMKGDIDYNAPRERGYTPTQKELDYIHNDTEIVAKALKMQFDSNMVKLTSAGDAEDEFNRVYSKYKHRYYAKDFHFNDYNNNPKIDQFVRMSYCGGISWVNPEIKEKVVYNGVVYDYNSMYPSVMKMYPMPIKFPRYIKEIPKDDKILWVGEMVICCKRKKGYPACLRNPDLKEWVEGEYSGTIHLTSVDWEIIQLCYDIYHYNFIQGFDYGYGEMDTFKEYIEIHEKEKIANKEVGGFSYQRPKLFLNSLYGKFGKNPLNTSKIPFLDENGMLRFRIDAPCAGMGRNVAVASFITAYARRELVRGILSSEGTFCYCDTDSIHLAEKDGISPKFNGKIHPTDFGCWDCEGYWKRAKFLRPKTYIEEKYVFEQDDYDYEKYGIRMKLHKIRTDANGNKIHKLDDEGNAITELDAKACGCTAESKKYITFDNFQMGASYPDKKVPVMRKGGVQIIPRCFTIKEPFRK